MSTLDEQKSDRFGFRLSAEQRDLLERAALVREKTLTEFILESSCSAAENTLLDQRFFLADKSAFARFEKALEAPARVSKELRKLLSQTAPWE